MNQARSVTIWDYHYSIKDRPFTAKILVASAFCSLTPGRGVNTYLLTPSSEFLKKKELLVKNI